MRHDLCACKHDSHTVWPRPQARQTVLLPWQFACTRHERPSRRVAMNVLPGITAVLAISVGLAAQNPPPPPSSRTAAEHEVREFIRAAGESGLAEVAFAGIAKQR